MEGSPPRRRSMGSIRSPLRKSPLAQEQGGSPFRSGPSSPGTPAGSPSSPRGLPLVVDDEPLPVDLAPATPRRAASARGPESPFSRSLASTWSESEPIFERMEDLLAETAIYAVGNDQKAERWKAPSRKVAEDVRRRALWRQGAESVATATRSMGEMGIGMELYFFVTHRVAVLFTWLSIIHLPAMLLHARAWDCAGTGDVHGLWEHTLRSCDDDLSKASAKELIFRMTLGDGCPDGVEVVRLFTHAVWRRAHIAPVSLRPSPKALAILLSMTQLVTTLLVCRFASSLGAHMVARLNELQLQHSTASQFTVLVTQVPPDIDEHELLRHFSRRYNLNRRQIRYPIYGLSVRGAVFWSVMLTCLFVFLAAVTAVWLSPVGPNSFAPLFPSWAHVAGAAALAALCGVLAYFAASRRRLGRPESLPPLREEHALLRRRWLELHESLPPCYARRVESRLTEFETSWLRRRMPDPKPISDTGHLALASARKAYLSSQLHDKQAALSAAKRQRYEGKWVADVSLIRSNGELIRQYMQVRQLWRQVQVSRAEVRRWSAIHGPHPNMARCRQALNRLEVLVELMKDAQRELSRSVDQKGVDQVTGAFVTFAHEWSAYRCIEDYKHSSRTWLRKNFQPLNFQLHRKTKRRFTSASRSAAAAHAAAAHAAGRRGHFLRGAAHPNAAPGPSCNDSSGNDSNDDPNPGQAADEEEAVDFDYGGLVRSSTPLAVKPAPSPDDVLWENLGVPAHVKTLRRGATLVLSCVLLGCTMVITGYKISVTRYLKASVPTLDHCREALASHLGYYPANETCAMMERLSTNDTDGLCPASYNFVGLTADDGVTYLPSNSRDASCDGGCVRPDSALLGPYGFASDDSTARSSLERNAFANSTRPLGYAQGRSLELCDTPCFQEGAADTGPYRAAKMCDALACGVQGWTEEGEVCSDGGKSATRFDGGTLTHCYCEAKLGALHVESISAVYFRIVAIKTRHWLGLETTQPWQKACRSYIKRAVSLLWIDRLMIAAIVGVNSLIFVLFSALEKFERHNSVSSALVNTAAKTFVLTFTNTAFIVPLFNMKCGNKSDLNHVGLRWACNAIFIGDHVTLSRRWYEQVGSLITQTVCLNMLFSLGSRLWLCFVQDAIKVNLFASGCVTQTQLNDLLTPRRFCIETRFTYLLTYILTALVYCAGIPVLLPLAAAYFWASYICDKYMVLRRYQHPPSYDSKLPQLVCGLFRPAVVMHLAAASVMLSNTTLVTSGSFFETRQPVLRLYVALARNVLGGDAARLASTTAVAPLVLTALVLVLLSLSRRLGKLFNLELFPFCNCRFVASRTEFYKFLKSGAKRAWRCAYCCVARRGRRRRQRRSRNGSVAPQSSSEDEEAQEEHSFRRQQAALVPQNTRPAETWRREFRCLANGPRMTRPGFTDPFRFVAPLLSQSRETHAKLEMDALAEQSAQPTALADLQPAVKRMHKVRKAVGGAVWKAVGGAVSFQRSAPMPSTRRGSLPKIALAQMAKSPATAKRTFAFRKAKIRPSDDEEKVHDGGDGRPDVGDSPRFGIGRAMSSLSGSPRGSPRSSPRVMPRPWSTLADNVPPAQQSLSSLATRGTFRRAKVAPNSTHSRRPRTSTIQQIQQERMIVLYAQQWTRPHLISAVKDGWRIAPEADDGDGRPPAGLPKRVARQPLELRRVHPPGSTNAGRFMKTWEMIDFERRLFSYDIMGNPRYKLALDFLESVGTFRPKRELVKEIGVFSEKVVQLQDRCQRQQLDRVLAARAHEMRLERLRRRAAVAGVVKTLVADVELRDAHEAAARARKVANRKRETASASRDRGDCAAVVDALVAAVEARAVVDTAFEMRSNILDDFAEAQLRAASLERDICAEKLDSMITSLELSAAESRARLARSEAVAKASRSRDAVEAQSRGVMDRQVISVLLDFIVSTVETRFALAETVKLQAVHAQMELSGHFTKSSELAKAEAQRLNLVERNDHLTKALGQQTSLAQQFEKVALMAQASSDRESARLGDLEAKREELQESRRVALNQVEAFKATLEENKAALTQMHRFKTVSAAVQKADAGTAAPGRTSFGDFYAADAPTTPDSTPHRRSADRGAAGFTDSASPLPARAVSFQGQQTTPRASVDERLNCATGSLRSELFAAVESAERTASGFRATEALLLREKDDLEADLEMHLQQAKADAAKAQASSAAADLRAQESAGNARRSASEAEKLTAAAKRLASEYEANAQESNGLRDSVAALRAQRDAAVHEASDLQRYAAATREDAQKTATTLRDAVRKLERSAADQASASRGELEDRAFELAQQKGLRAEAEAELFKLKDRFEAELAAAAARVALDALEAGKRSLDFELKSAELLEQQRIEAEARFEARAAEAEFARASALAAEQAAHAALLSQLVADRDDAEKRAADLAEQLAFRASDDSNRLAADTANSHLELELRQARAALQTALRRVPQQERGWISALAPGVRPVDAVQYDEYDFEAYASNGHASPANGYAGNGYASSANGYVPADGYAQRADGYALPAAHLVSPAAKPVSPTKRYPPPVVTQGYADLHGYAELSKPYAPSLPDYFPAQQSAALEKGGVVVFQQRPYESRRKSPSRRPVQ